MLIHHLSRSIGLTLSALILLSSMIIGLGLTIWELRSALSNQRQSSIEKSEELLLLASGSAANAAWTLDTELAKEVISGILSQSGVVAVEIRANLRDDHQEVLVRLENNLPKSDILVNWTAKHFFSDFAASSEDLIVDQDGKHEKVGNLLIEFSPQYAAKIFTTRVYTSLAVGLIEALSVGLILLFIVRWFVATPLIRSAAKIAQIKPQALDAADYSISIPRLHTTNELGQLLAHTNKLLDRLVESRKELRRLATRDALTNLPNRTLVKENLSKSLSTAQRTGQQVAVIYLDLDRFKSVNDSLGHAVGDILLQKVAQILEKQVRDEDSIGRLGGDEFLAVLLVRNIKQVYAVVNRIVASLATPIRIGGHELQTCASIGIWEDYSRAVQVLPDGRL